MGDQYRFYSRGNNSRSIRDDDFDEEDVWAVVKEKKDSSSKIRKPKDSPLSPVPRHLPSAARMISRSQNAHSEGIKVVQQSAPVNIPDWSKIYGKNGSDSYLTGEGSWGNPGHEYGYHDDGDVNNGEEEEEEEDDDGRIPPHEWIAKKLARSQISSFSVCEGVGRTLKGRDLSKVRNAILTRTGFLEQNWEKKLG
ncbi:protein S40-4-like [Aristolochia californica]|uniref:protein S40-4-like n=1 Tax=Aristolochia californica TaxID=171875 RepID=UPI0035D8D1DA